MKGKEYEINIKATADTAGAEKAEEALEQVEVQAKATATEVTTAAEQVSGTFDTAAAEEMADALGEVEEKLEDVGDASSEADVHLKKLVNIERARVINEVVTALGSAARAVGALRKDLQGTDAEMEQTLGTVAAALGSVSNAAAGAAQGFAVGGPWGAAIGGFIGLAAGPLKTAINDMTDDLKAAAAAERNAEISMANYKATVAATAKELKESRFANFWDGVASQVNKATEAIRRQKAEMESGAKASTAERELAQKQAVASGADPAAVAVSDLGGDVQDRLARLEGDQAFALKAVEMLERQATDAALKAKDAATLGIEGVRELETEAGRIRQEAEKARADFDSDQKIAEGEAREIIAEAESRKIEAVRKFGEDAAASANELVKELENSGAPLAASNLAGIEKIKQITADQQVKADEQTALMEAFAQAMAGVQLNTERFLSVTTKQKDSTDLLAQRLRALEAELDRVKQRAAVATTPTSVR